MRARAVLCSVLLILTLVVPAAQVRPIYDRGAGGLSLLLGRLQTTASALHTGAHPDDEDSSLLARLARGDFARVAYLALNRGEGGQNIIGTELFDALGVIRTEELLQARRLDGAEQFFTRTFDYGFSKTRAEAAAKWGEPEVLGDMVRIIRTFRPLVIASRFSGTPADGHGQHQLAGYLTPLAFRAAADPSQFPEQIAEGLRPWQAKKLYVGQGFRPNPKAPPTTDIATGVFDPVIGRTYAEIAMEGRSQHKSQEMGRVELKGPQHSLLRLLEPPTAPATEEHSLFDGVDVSIAGLPAIAGLPRGALSAEMSAVAAAAKAASAEYDAREPAAIVPHLAKGLAAVRSARARLDALGAEANAAADADFLLAFEEDLFGRALVAAVGLEIDPLADAETVAPGTSLSVDVRAFTNGSTGVRVGDARVEAPAGWRVAPASAPAERDDRNPFARFFRETPAKSSRFTVIAAADAPFTEPYWLTEPPDGGLFHWPAGSPAGRPFAPPILHARVPVEIGGVTVEVVRPVEYRFGDRIRGEIRRNVEVVPALDVELDSRLFIVSTKAPAEQRIAVRLASNTSGPMQGSVALIAPTGWQVSPAKQSFALAERDEATSLSFTLQPPAHVAAGTFQVKAQATVGGHVFSDDMQTIAYPHIQTRRLYEKAAAKLQAFDLSVAPMTIGYVMGSGDQVPDAIRRLGLGVELLDAEQLAAGDLSRFPTIVVGVRASEARPDFVANHGRLLDYVKNGGTLIVQYQQTDYAERGLAPFPGEIGPRVTDETAPITILEPAHRVFTTPNRITAADFEGWVQERNLYSFGTFDAHYTPLLESHDPNEPPNKGGLLYAEIGKGRWVYASYAFFRQLPAGVPGAYRLFANLLALGAQ